LRKDAGGQLNSESEIVPTKQSPARLAIPALVVAFPAVLFYTILFRTALDIPFYDEYGTLVFIDKMIHIHGWIDRVKFIFETQFNEYKLIFAETVVWLQFLFVGRTDFKLLSAISNAFVLLLALLLWRMFLPSEKDMSKRLTLFIPVSWLLFQLQYFEILNWGGAGLQHIPSTVFAFAAIYFITRLSRTAFCAALLCYLLAIASSGTGFLLIPIGLLLLASVRNYQRIVIWLVTSAACILVYFYRYNVMSSKSSPDHSIASALLHMQPAIVFGFIGGSATIPFRPLSFVLGVGLSIFFVWLGFRGYFRKNPAVSGCILFLLLTAVGVAGIRSGQGIAGGIPSRYTFFSALFLILAWFAVAEQFLQKGKKNLLDSGVYLCFAAASMSFCIFMDTLNLIEINSWDKTLVEGMKAFEHPTPPDLNKGPLLPLWKGDIDREAYNPQARAILIESMRLGIYRPPQL